MSAISPDDARTRAETPRGRKPRANDPRVLRTRAAVVEAARTLFLRQGYAGTTMEEIAALARVTKRTLYNNYADKESLFTQIVVDAIAYANRFAGSLRDEFGTARYTAANMHDALHDLGRRMALAVVRPEIIALRRLLIGEVRGFPTLAAEYFNRAPGQVLESLAAGFALFHERGIFNAPDARCAAAQFAYLVVGEHLDRAMLVGTNPTPEFLTACAREGVATFLTRYAVAPPNA